MRRWNAGRRGDEHVSASRMSGEGGGDFSGEGDSPVFAERRVGQSPRGGAQCRECGAAVMDASKFCPNCGTRMQEVCFACGAVSAAGAKFCGDCGADGTVRYTEYPDLKHDCWTRTYENPELYAWLLDQKRQ